MRSLTIKHSLCSALRTLSEDCFHEAHGKGTKRNESFYFGLRFVFKAQYFHDNRSFFDAFRVEVIIFFFN